MRKRSHLVFSIEAVDTLMKTGGSAKMLRGRLNLLEEKAAQFSHYLCYWPALADSFDKDVDRVRELLKKEKHHGRV